MHVLSLNQNRWYALIALWRWNVKTFYSAAVVEWIIIVQWSVNELRILLTARTAGGCNVLREKRG